MTALNYNDSSSTNYIGVSEIINSEPSFDFDSNVPDTTATSSNSFTDIDSIFQSYLTSNYDSNDMHQPEYTMVDPDYQPTLLDTVSSVDSNYVTLNSIQNIGNELEQLHIIAEPKATYRGRYICEIREGGNRTNRFIRAEPNGLEHEYPTVKILPEWNKPNRQLYIRLTLVTVPNERKPRRCIHPYGIDTPNDGDIKDRENNSLFFRIDPSDYVKGEKSFRILLKKQKQETLKSQPMRLFDSEQQNNIDMEAPIDAKKKISLYQLNKSQLVFTLAEQYGYNYFPVPILHTSVESQIMTDIGMDDPSTSMNPVIERQTNIIKCVPQKGDWDGGDEVVVIVSEPIRRRVNYVLFDFGLCGTKVINEILQNDTKTISFQTPACLGLEIGENVKATVTIAVNNLTLGPINFEYVPPTRIMYSVCPRCQGAVWNGPRDITGYRLELEDFEFESGENLLSKMKQLSIAEEKNKDESRTASDETNSKFEKYLNRLKAASEKFIRTNDPSRLFRQVRALLTRCDENPPPLHDAIQRGHTQLALSLIEQVLDMSPSQGILEKQNENGETPLLIAAKLNQWKLMEPILRNRLDLVQQKDKAENNLFHLLAEINDDEGAATIQNVINILPNEITTKMLKQRNKDKQIPLQIAESRGNSSSCKLLI
ncbi:unnamed protein product [Rotaria socialis]|uniref:RHD domain-containing protein n=1 Tax=Rotaria socialis TaxID=392032 RepID=A0A817KS63_9BILA|nr:unnamed protein product [Rotaria socialis]CAF3371448.1 unnamed protein product [Rotaria socialis]